MTLSMLFISCSDKAGVAADGAKLYETCAGCHGKDGKKKAFGKSGAIAGRDVDGLVKELEAYKAGKLNKKGMGGMMQGQLTHYSEEDIEAVSKHISKLPK
ncbi:MAG: c-type cytochrome [Sulfurovum sp.]|nr:c-type cytochrome [Sulfurovum sp.]